MFAVDVVVANNNLKINLSKDLSVTIYRPELIFRSMIRSILFKLINIYTDLKQKHFCLPT